MRYGVIADVHANLHALEAVLAFLGEQELDGYLCAGDLVGYGPLPNECVRRVLDLGATCVAGNHDLIALGRLSDERCIPLAQNSLRWTRASLDDDTCGQLAALPMAARVGDIALHHGSPLDVEEYVVTEAQALATLAELPRTDPGAEIVVLGHTHRPVAVGARSGSWLRAGTGVVPLPRGEPILLNPGAVGQSRTRDPRARAMVLDLGRREATFHAVAYDVEACRQALRERNLPPDSCHRPLSRAQVLAGAAKRSVRRAQARLSLK